MMNRNGIMQMGEIKSCYSFDSTPSILRQAQYATESEIHSIENENNVKTQNFASQPKN